MTYKLFSLLAESIKESNPGFFDYEADAVTTSYITSLYISRYKKLFPNNNFYRHCKNELVSIY